MTIALALTEVFLLFVHHKASLEDVVTVANPLAVGTAFIEAALHKIDSAVRKSQALF